MGADSTPLNVIAESLVELCNKGLVMPTLASIIKNATRNLLGIGSRRSPSRWPRGASREIGRASCRERV